MLEDNATQKWTKSVFQDPAWLAAAFIAVWGVLISLDSFSAANFFAALAAFVIILKLAAENHLIHKDRRYVRFMLGASIVLMLLASDLQWTSHRAKAAVLHEKQQVEKDQLEARTEAEKDITINGLKDQVSNLQGVPKNVQDLQKDESTRAGKSTQQIADLKAQNEKLESSIDDKEQKLAEIAKEELDLNYLPNVIISTSGTNSIQFWNHGRTAVTVTAGEVAGHPFPIAAYQSVSSESATTFVLTWTDNTLPAIPKTGKYDLPYDGLIRFQAANGVSYKISFRLVLRFESGTQVAFFATSEPPVKE